MNIVNVSCSVMSDSLRPHRLWPARLLCPWNSPGKNTGMVCHSLLQWLFLTQGLNPGLLHSRLSHQGWIQIYVKIINRILKNFFLLLAFQMLPIILPFKCVQQTRFSRNGTSSPYICRDLSLVCVCARSVVSGSL